MADHDRPASLEEIRRIYGTCFGVWRIWPRRRLAIAEGVLVSHWQPPPLSFEFLNRFVRSRGVDTTNRPHQDLNDTATQYQYASHPLFFGSQLRSLGVRAYRPPLP